MKKIIIGLITIIVLLVSNYLVSNFFKLEFIEMSFITGLLYTIGIGFFSSEGGITTEMTNTAIKRFMASETRTKDHFFNLHINTPFIVSIVYTIIAAIASVVTYWKYF